MDNVKILTEEETIDYVLNTKSSICRFGDGEFRIMRGFGISFQEHNQILQNKLISIINTKNEINCLIAIPPIYKHTTNYDNKTTKYWNSIKNTKSIINANNLINPENIYGSSFISRIECLKTLNIYEYINNIKNLMLLGKNIFIINEKVKIKIDKKMSLLNYNIENYIIIPENNAFEKYEYICESIRKYGINYTFVICAGPTATIISYEMSREGYFILDMGHFFDLLYNK